MTTELYDALLSILIVTVACLILSPILVWVLPIRDDVTKEV